MDAATMHRVFEPFFTTKAETGTGLGMWVVSQLVDRHHGQVSIRSGQLQPWNSTIISVFLPLGSIEAVDQKRRLESTRASRLGRRRYCQCILLRLCHALLQPGEPGVEPTFNRR